MWPGWVLALALAGGCSSEADLPAVGPRSIVLITVDTLRTDHLGFYGYDRPTSPNIDSLLQRSLVFTNAVATWPSTSPSFGSLFTSTYVHTNGMKRRTLGYHLREDVETLAEILERYGFYNAAVVANGALGQEYGFAQGFMEYVEPWKIWPDEDPENSVRADRVTQLALDLIPTLPDDRPFLFWVHYLDPHQTYAPPEPFREQFDALVPQSEGQDTVTCEPLLNSRGGHVQEGGSCTLAGLVARYDAEIAFTDQQVGLLLEALEQAGIMDEALVVFTADHAEALGDGKGLFFGHSRSVRQNEIRVPLAVRLPGSPREGGSFGFPVDLVDLAPTLLGVLGLPRGAVMQGDDLSGLVRGVEDQALPQHAFTEAGSTRNYMRAVLTDRFKLIHVPDKSEQRFMAGTQHELYDLLRDPEEIHNLVEERPDLVEELLPVLEGWRSSDLGFVAGAEVEETAPDPETLEQLRALGYLN